MPAFDGPNFNYWFSFFLSPSFSPALISCCPHEMAPRKRPLELASCVGSCDATLVVRVMRQQAHRSAKLS